MKGSNDRLEAVANRIARETIKVWETHVQSGQQALVQSHQKSFSVLDQAGVRIKDRSVIKSLTDLVCDENKLLREAAVSALGRIGVPDPTVINSLIDRLGDEQLRVRQTAAEALGQIGLSDPVQ